MSRVALLLRGVNLGPSHKVPMADLRALLADAGYGRPTTLLNSGNAVVETDRTPDDVEAHVAGLLGERFGFAVPTLVRTAADLDALRAAWPWPEADEDPKGFHVMFCSTAPARDVVDGLGDVEEPYRYRVAGREVLVRSPRFTDSPVWALLTEKRLGVRTTVRTWQTVTRLTALTAP